MHVPTIDFDNCLGFDLETWGTKQEYALQPFRALTGDAGIRAASFARQDKASGLLNPSKSSLASVLTKAADQSLYVVGWNVSFDAAWCIAVDLEDLVFRIKWLDAMLLWRHAVVEPEGEDIPKQKRKSYALKAAMLEYFPDEAGFKDFEDFQATDEASLVELMRRNKGDALFTLKLAEMFWSMLTDAQRNAALIEARCIPQVAKTKVLGLRANREAAQALSEILETQRVKLNADLLEISPEAEGVNFGSPKQLQELLYKTWGLPCNRFSKKTADPSTDKYALFDLAFLDPRAKMLKEFREAKNNRTKYAEATLKSLAYNGDGFVRPGAHIFSTYTSRMTYSSSDKATVIEEKTTKAKGLHTVERKVEVPTGIALHQWKRGKEFRRIIQAPEGYSLVELDFAGQEFGWMAVASGDETMLELRAPGEDAHSFMGAQIAEIDYKELIMRVHDEDPVASLQRKLGKFCIAEGELVLTDHGLVAIEKVSLDMRVWDGVEFVTHTGSIYQGEKEVITYAGLTATPDHMVYLQDGSSCYFEIAAATGSRLAQAGSDGYAVWLDKNKFDQPAEGWSSHQSRLRMLEMLEVCMGQLRQPESRKDDAVQDMRNPAATHQCRARDHQRCCNGAGTETMQRDEAEVRKPKGSIIQELRRAWDSLQVWIGCRSHKLYLKRTASSDVPTGGHRPEREQRPLRAGEFAAGNEGREFSQQTNQQVPCIQVCTNPAEACLPRSSHTPPRGDVCRSRCAEFDVEGVVDSRHGGSMVYPKLQTKRVYDITNAGPRHRYTVSNYLVSNSNLSFQYRVSAKTATVKARVDYELNVEETFIGQILGKYKLAYPGVPTYWKTQILKCKQLGYAETFAGRRVQLGGSWAGRDAWPMESTAINYPIQGTGGDQKYLALAVARNELPKWGGYFYYELHDGLFFIFPHDKAEAAARHFKKILSTLPYRAAWGVNLPIDFPVDAKLGASWGDLKDVKG